MFQMLFLRARALWLYYMETYEKHIINMLMEIKVVDRILILGTVLISVQMNVTYLLCKDS